MELPDFLVADPDGLILVRGHRLGLHDVVPLFNEGFSAEMLHEQYPTLPLATLYKLIAFYLEHQDEIDALVGEHDRETARQRAAAPHGPDQAELRRRFAALRRAEAS